MVGEPISNSSNDGSSIRLPLPDPVTLRQQHLPPSSDLVINVYDIIFSDQQPLFFKNPTPAGTPANGHRHGGRYFLPTKIMTNQ
ncbi:hypothetical protein ACLOJK_037282, partial [Asimina triloba]